MDEGSSTVHPVMEKTRKKQREERAISRAKKEPPHKEEGVHDDGGAAPFLKAEKKLQES